MTSHPIRLTGMVVGVQQSFDYLERMQERVINFVVSHSNITAEKFRELMMTTGELARDVGTIVVGEGAVQVGLIDRVGGLGEALANLKTEMRKRKEEMEGTEAKDAAPSGYSPAARRKSAGKGSKKQNGKALPMAKPSPHIQPQPQQRRH